MPSMYSGGLWSRSTLRKYEQLNNSIMKKNMGSLDKTIRLILAIGIALLVYFEVVTGTIAYILIALAGIFVLTSFLSFCPLYAPFGLSTCKRK